MKPIRKKKKSNIKSTSDRLRLSVFCSNKFIYAQLIDDSLGKTIASSSSLKQKNGGNKEAAKKVGAEIAASAKKSKISDVVFHRGNHLYHGCVAELAQAARNGGLNF